jgi:hypothetical protein
MFWAAAVAVAAEGAVAVVRVAAAVAAHVVVTGVAVAARGRRLAALRR